MLVIFMMYELVGFVRKDNRQYEKWFEKKLKILRKAFVRVKVEHVDNDVIILIPKYKKYNRIVSKLISSQINKYVGKFKIKELVFEQELDFIKKKINIQQFSNGKLIMKNSLIKIFGYMFKINKKNINLEDVYVLVNEYNKENIYIINELIESFKTVNIITENIRRFKRLENQLFDSGVLITVSNNKRKSLRNATYIINIDFDKNKIMLYNIKSNSTIINLTDENIELKSNFNGVLINNIELQIDKDKDCFINEFYGNINKKIFIEMLIKKNNRNLEYIKKISQEYSAKISELIGIRGKLENNEFLL